MRFNWFAILAAVVVFAGVATRASALDLTGTWDGKVKCAVHTDGEADEKGSGTITAQISQTGSNVDIQVDGTNGFGLHIVSRGVVAANQKHPNKGYLATIDCGSSDSSGGGIESYKAKADPESGSGKLTGTVSSFYFGTPAAIIPCKVTLKRSSTATPSVTSCSAP